MKILKYILLTVVSLVVIAAAFFAYGLYINPKSPKGTAEYSSGSTEIDIRYYRPFKNNRLIFGAQEDGALVPYGQYWRLGANLTTRLTTNTDLSFASRSLPAGSYGLYTYPYKDHWLLVVHEKTGGFSNAEPDPAAVVMKLNLPVESLPEVVEQFTIDFLEQNIRLRWDTTQVLIPFSE